MAMKAKHAFGTLERVDAALNAGTIDAYDILFLKDANGKPYVGWIDKDGNKVIVEETSQVVRVDELPTANGDENVMYIYNNEAYIWNGTECASISKPADLGELESQVSGLDTQVSGLGTQVSELGGQVSGLEDDMKNKVDADQVQTMIEDAIGNVVQEENIVEF